MERKTAHEYPQELLNLFDIYVHGGMDRRQFLEGAQKFAVGGADYGALVGAQLGHKYASSLYGIHLGNEMAPGMLCASRYAAILVPVTLSQLRT